MIGFMPKLYEDELLYSVFSRYYVRSGHMVYRAASEELFQNPLARPDILMMNAYKKEVIDVLGASMETLVKEHTMFPAFAVFLPYERRKDAFCSLVQIDGKHQNLLAMPVKKRAKVLRYCPVCAREDREQYGETYWHRTWQISDICVCSKHRCYLQDTDIILSGKATPAFLTAEERIPENQEVRYCHNELEMRLSQYITDIFQTEMDMENQVSVGRFLHAQMQGTKYLSMRGEQRNIGLLHQDFMKYYQDLQENDFTELWQIQKVFTDDRYRIQDVSMLGMFLGIEPEKLVNRTLPSVSQTEQFEEQIHLLHRQGLKYTEIAKKMQTSYDTVKCIGEGRYKKYNKGNTDKKSIQSGRKKQDWNRIDRETLPLVKRAITDIWEDKVQEGKPGRVTVNAVTKALGLPDKQISHLPLCNLEIQKHIENYPRYWARKVVWAVQQVRQNGDELNWKRVRELTNLRKSNFQSCFPYLIKEADKELAEEIMGLIET